MATKKLKPVTRQELTINGLGSSRREVQGQQRLPMDLGKQENDFDRMGRPLPTWPGLATDRRQKVTETQKNTYGTTMNAAIKNHGELIDTALRQGPRGQHFYAGGGRSADVDSHVGRDAMIQMAKFHDVPVHVAAAVRGVLSPRSNVHDELTNLHTVMNHMKANPGHQGAIPGIGGLAGTRNSANAAAIMNAHQQGIHPLDAEIEVGKSGKSRKVLDSPKVASYIQGYTHPDDARATIDTHAVGGMSPHLPKSAPKIGNGKFDKKGKEYQSPVNKSDPRWVPNQEDALGDAGSYQFYAHAATKAAEQRGLTASEGQALAWFPQREKGNQQPGTGNAKKRGAGGPKQLPLFNDRRA
jgi:hypothetical protein